MMEFFKKLFCQHKFEVMRNIQGDEIIVGSCDWGPRMVFLITHWSCAKCGKVEERYKLWTPGK